MNNFFILTVSFELMFKGTNFAKIIHFVIGTVEHFYLSIVSSKQIFMGTIISPKSSTFSLERLNNFFPIA